MLRLSAKRKTTRITLPVICYCSIGISLDVCVDRIPFPMRATFVLVPTIPERQAPVCLQPDSFCRSGWLNGCSESSPSLKPATRSPVATRFRSQAIRMCSHFRLFAKHLCCQSRRTTNSGCSSYRAVHCFKPSARIAAVPTRFKRQIE